MNLETSLISSFKSLVQYALLVFILLAYPFMTCAQSQHYSYWLSFMEHYGTGNTEKIISIVGPNAHSGWVDIPNRQWRYPFLISSTGVTRFIMPDFTEMIGSESVEDIGIHLSSDEYFTVFVHEFKNSMNETSAILPEHALGRRYYVMSYKGCDISSIPGLSQFLILAIKDDTELQIIPAANTQSGRPSNSPFSISLDMGETYQVQAKTAEGDMSGSLITGNKSFAVYAGVTATEVPENCGQRDNMLEQMFPVDMWGKEYVTVPNAMADYDIIRIMASEDNTHVHIKGAVDRDYFLSSGEYVEYQETEASHVLSDKPILLAQFSTGTSCNGHQYGDPSMVLMNSMSQLKTDIRIYSSPYENVKEHYVSIIVLNDDASSVKIDGMKLQDMTMPHFVGPDDRYVYADLKLISGVHRITSEGCGLLARTYGYGEEESYSHNGESAYRKTNADFIPDSTCLGDSTYFDGVLDDLRFSFNWLLGDGTSKTDKSFYHFYEELGSYSVQLIIYDHCLQRSDTFEQNHEIVLRKAVDVITDQVVCEGDSFHLAAFDPNPTASYFWYGPNGFPIEDQFPFFTDAKKEQSGQYTVISDINGCASYPAYLNVQVVSKPAPDLGQDRTFCVRLGDNELHPGIFSTYRWQDFSDLPSYYALQDGLYWVEVMDSLGCKALDSVYLIQECPIQLYIPNVFSPNNDGVNDGFGPLSNRLTKGQLQVYDHWGNRVFDTQDLSQQWNGEIKGKPAHEGVYAWILIYDMNDGLGSENIKVLSGSVILLR